MRFYSSAELYATELHDSAPENRWKRGPAKKGGRGAIRQCHDKAETSKGVCKTSGMSTGRKDDRNEDVCAYPLEVSEIERFRGAMEKRGNCTVPLSFSFCFLDICWPRRARRIVEDWIGMPRRAPDLGKGENPKRGLEGMERGRAGGDQRSSEVVRFEI